MRVSARLILLGTAVLCAAGFILADTGKVQAASVSSNVYESKKTKEEKDDCYEFYLTKEEVEKDIEDGYVFRMDKTFEEKAMPTVMYSQWFFKVYEDNTLNLDIAFSNLFTTLENGEGGNGFGFMDFDKQVKVEVVSPEDEVVYTFEKLNKKIKKDTKEKKQIALTPGKWCLRISFYYFSRGGDQPSNLKISAEYEKPSKKDIKWLKKERLKDSE